MYRRHTMEGNNGVAPDAFKRDLIEFLNTLCIQARTHAKILEYQETTISPAKIILCRSPGMR